MSRRNEAYVPLLCNYPDSEKINRVSEGAEAMFCRLLAKCDDDGNYHGEPKRLLGKLFTLRYENGTMVVQKVKKYLKELVGVGLITRYESETVRYVHVNRCKKSLRKDVVKKVYYPEFDETTQTFMSKQDNESVTDRPENDAPIQTNPNQSKPIQTKKQHIDFVFLTKTEYEKLEAKFGKADLKEKIVSLNDYIGSKGVKYKSHYYTILAWARKNGPAKPKETTEERLKRVFPNG